MDASQGCYCWAVTGTPIKTYFLEDPLTSWGWGGNWEAGRQGGRPGWLILFTVSLFLHPFLCSRLCEGHTAESPVTLTVVWRTLEEKPAPVSWALISKPQASLAHSLCSIPVTQWQGRGGWERVQCESEPELCPQPVIWWVIVPKK